MDRQRLPAKYIIVKTLIVYNVCSRSVLLSLYIPKASSALRAGNFSNICTTVSISRRNLLHALKNICDTKFLRYNT
jgi:hypothetical protein